MKSKYVFAFAVPIAFIAGNLWASGLDRYPSRAEAKQECFNWTRAIEPVKYITQEMRGPYAENPIREVEASFRTRYCEYDEETRQYLGYNADYLLSYLPTQTEDFENPFYHVSDRFKF